MRTGINGSQFSSESEIFKFRDNGGNLYENPKLQHFLYGTTKYPGERVPGQRGATVLPAPAVAAPDPTMTMSGVYAGVTPPGVNPQATIPLYIGMLREKAERCTRELGGLGAQ